MRLIITIVVLIYIVLAVIVSCGPAFYHDSSNPCATGDKPECDLWKVKYPKDYQRYIKRGGVDVFKK